MSSKGTGLVTRPRFFIYRYYSFIMEDKSINSLRDCHTCQLRNFLAWNVIKIIKISIAMLTAGNSPNTMISFLQFTNNLKISTPIFLNALHLILSTILQRWSWWTSFMQCIFMESSIPTRSYSELINKILVLNNFR